jgi:hypothetical protein
VVAPAAPLPEPMLLRSGPLPTRGDWAYEVKWDGFRALVSTEGGLRVRSRRGWNMTELVPELGGNSQATHVSHEDFVPPDFAVPARLETELFTLEPLGPEHNERDYDAWTSSKEHIHATPGWHDSSWPRAMTLDENRGDLERHADDFRKRTGFTYTVLDRPSGDVVGCVYIYPVRDSEHDARVLSWVRASRADLDVPLWRSVGDWIAAEWPFRSVEYAERPGLASYSSDSDDELAEKFSDAG